MLYNILMIECEGNRERGTIYVRSDDMILKKCFWQIVLVCEKMEAPVNLVFTV